MSSRFSHTIEYTALRFMEVAITALPRRVALYAGSVLGSLLHASGSYHRVVRANMRHTGHWTDTEIHVLMPRLYRMMGRYVADFLYSRGRVPPHDFTASALLEGCIARGKGTMGIMAHLGNFEILANIFGKSVPDLNVITMPMTNPAVERWLNEKRDGTGIQIIHKNHAVRPTLAVLQRNGVVAILIDQYAGKHGTVVPFLGQDASTVRTVPGMMRKTGCSVVAGAALLQGNGTYHIEFEVLPDLGIPPDPEEEFIRAYQVAHNNLLSRWIFQYPEHYFGWFHKRFRGTVNYRA